LFLGPRPPLQNVVQKYVKILYPGPDSGTLDPNPKQDRHKNLIGWSTRHHSVKFHRDGPVSTWMGDRMQAGKPSWYVTSHPGQLSLDIPSWVGAMSTYQQKLGRKQAHSAMQ